MFLSHTLDCGDLREVSSKYLCWTVLIDVIVNRSWFLESREVLKIPPLDKFLVRDNKLCSKLHHLSQRSLIYISTTKCNNVEM